MTTDDNQTPDPTTPALLSAARLDAAIVEAIVADLSDRRGLRHEWQAIDDDIREEIKATWIGIVGRHLAALTAPAPADGGRRLYYALNPTAHERAWEGHDADVRARYDAQAATLHARGYLAGARGERGYRGDMGGEVVKRDAEIGGEAGDLGVAHDRALAHGVAVVASTERAMQAQIDALAAELAEARAGHDRMRHARDLLQVQVEEANERADKAEAAARRDGAREERARWQDICADLAANPEHERTAMIAVGRARLDEARRARGEGQGS